jgi:hypothetical protein
MLFLFFSSVTIVLAAIALTTKYRRKLHKIMRVLFLVNLFIFAMQIYVVIYDVYIIHVFAELKQDALELYFDFSIPVALILNIFTLIRKKSDFGSEAPASTLSLKKYIRKVSTISLLVVSFSWIVFMIWMVAPLVTFPKEDHPKRPEFKIGESKASIIARTPPCMIHKEIDGSKVIEIGAPNLMGYSEPNRKLGKKESLMILDNGIYLYFDQKNILIAKEIVKML